jgi:GYF domain 2
MASDAQIPIPDKPAMPDAWFYVDDGRAVGPIPLAKLRDVLVTRPDRGRLDLVWRDGFVSWLKAGEVLELASSVPRAPTPTPYLAGEGSL